MRLNKNYFSIILILFICHSIMAAEVEVLDEDGSLTVELLVAEYLGCISFPTITMGPTYSGNTSPPTFQWSGPNGFNATVEVVTINDPGLYSVTVTDPANSCFGVASVEISGSITPPTADAGPDQVIGCNPSFATLVAGPTTAAFPSYKWFDSSGFLVGNGTSVQVNLSDTYTLLVFDSDNECSNSDEVEVLLNTVLPTVNASSDGDLTCNNNAVTLDGSNSSGAGQLSFEWLGPSNFVATSPIVSVSIAGEYELTVTDNSNGCISSTLITVQEDFENPDATATANGSLTCVQQSVILTGSSVASNVTFSWTGPNNFTSSLQSPVVSDEGLYFLMVTGSNGCTDTDVAYLIGDYTVPDINITTSFDNVLTCLNPEVTIEAGSSNLDVNYLWTGPNNFSSSSYEIIVSVGGVYTVLVTDTGNGCADIESIVIEENFNMPIADAGNDQAIICTASSATLGGPNTSTGSDIDIVWEGPNGFMINTLNPLVSEPGIYTLQVSDYNSGCIAIDEVEVECTCIENLNITGNPIPSGTYKAVYEVQSASEVPVNGNVTFHAGNKVYLAPGFKVKAGADFKGKIEVCQ